MKKKLIAIVASLAMVATMVPASAFAAARDTGITLDELSVPDSSNANDWSKRGMGASYKTLYEAGNEDNVEFTTRGNTITLNGVVPYNELENYSTTKDLQAGNYVGIKMTLPSSGTWYIKEDAIHTLADKSVTNATDLTKLGSGDRALIKRLEGKVYTVEFYNLAGGAAIGKKNASGTLEDADTLKDYLWFKNTAWTAAQTYRADQNSAYANHAYGTLKELDDMVKGLDATKKASFTYDTSKLTLLNEKDTKALAEFVDDVKLIDGASILDITADDTVDKAYKNNVAGAQLTYDGLTEYQKSVINATASQPKAHNYKKAYEALEIAKKNVAGDGTVEKLKEDIAALPELPKTAFADKAAIEAAYTPMADAEKAFDSLTETQQGKVDNIGVLTTYRTNYDRLIKAFVDPIYEKAAAINLENPLTDEDIALITELKGYVDGKYIDTKNIAKFNQATYDALVAALSKVEKDAKSLANAEVTVAGADSIVYDGSKKTPDVTVTIGGKEVAADAYDKIYSDNKDAGEAIITIIPKDESGYTGKKEATFTIKAADLTADMVKVANATYTGKAVTPAVSVASGVDYTVAYNNNTAVGKASAVVTGTGNYTGTITKNFIVKPAKESITSLKAGKKQITVAYKAQTGAKYRVICKASGLKAIGTNTTATKKTVKKLKSGKTYQVKVRAYKAVDGTTYYGAYSAVKKVKVK